METQLNLQVDLLERGTYQSLADLKEQLTLFSKQTFREEELTEEEGENDEDLTVGNPLNLENSDEKELSDDEDTLIADEELKDDDDEFPEETEEDINEEDEMETNEGMNEEDDFDPTR